MLNWLTSTLSVVTKVHCLEYMQACDTPLNAHKTIYSPLVFYMSEQNRKFNQKQTMTCGTSQQIEK